MNNLEFRLIQSQANAEQEIAAESARWRADLEQESPEVRKEFIEESGQRLINRYSTVASTYEKIFETVGFQQAANKAGKLVVSHLSLPIQLKKRRDNSTITAHMTAQGGRNLPNIYYDVSTKFLLSQRDTRDQELKTERFLPQFKSPETLSRPLSRLDFLRNDFNWVRSHESQETAANRFIKIRNAILPVILQAEDTQSLVIDALQDKELNPGMRKSRRAALLKRKPDK